MAEPFFRVHTVEPFREAQRSGRWEVPQSELTSLQYDLAKVPDNGLLSAAVDPAVGNLNSGAQVGPCGERPDDAFGHWKIRFGPLEFYGDLHVLVVASAQYLSGETDRLSVILGVVICFDNPCPSNLLRIH